MRSSLLSLLAGLSLLGGAPALAQQGGGTAGQNAPEQGMGGMKGGVEKEKGGAMGGSAAAKPDESKKHLSEIDVYLRDALNNTKVLYSTTQFTPGKLDTTIEREDVGNIDRSISSALTHVSHLKSMPEARVPDTAKLDALQRDLTQARSVAAQLRTAVRSDARDQIATLSGQLYAKLKAADDDFGAIADRVNLVRVDRISIPERQPVGGHEGAGTPPSGMMKEQPGGTMKEQPGGTMKEQPGGTAPTTPPPAEKY